MSKGKHRKQPERKAGKLAAVGALAVAPLAVTGSANAADWDELAQCESSGNWSINSGNGFSGGLQFTPSTWSGFGGDQYAANAHQATREEQIAVAENVLAVQGSGAWPGCSAKTNWEGGSTTERTSVTDESSKTVTSSKATASVQAEGTYTVQSGDTMSGIASRSGVSLDAVVSANSDTVSDPAVIYPGQTLDIP